MNWVAPAYKDAATDTLEKRLWEAADQFRANSGLKAQEYSSPVLGLIFLRFAEARFATLRHSLETEGASSRRGSRAEVPPHTMPRELYFCQRRPASTICSAFPSLKTLAQRSIPPWRVERYNPQLAGVLPKPTTIRQHAVEGCSKKIGDPRFAGLRCVWAHLRIFLGHLPKARPRWRRVLHTRQHCPTPD